MFFFSTKLIGAALMPSSFLFGVCLVSGLLAVFVRSFRRGVWVFCASGLALIICGFSPIGNVMLAVLESRIPSWTQSDIAPDGILVLGGVLDEDLSAAHNRPVLGSGVDRIVAGAQLARRYPNARVVYSGGSPKLYPGQASEADYASSVFEACGVAPSRVLIEARSRNTWENAVFSRELIEPRNHERWLLVTSAFHMPRAVGIFRKIGFTVEPVPVDWRTAGLSDPFRLPGSFAGGLSRLDLALREWMGLIVYRLAGKIDKLFPG